jgi:hypothetical protein
MNLDRGDPEDEPEGPELSTCTVEASGSFGSTTWVVCKTLYDMLPRDTRNELLEMTGGRLIAPFFEKTCSRVLRQGGCTVDMSDLDSEWSFETADVTCAFGQVTWQIGEGFWKELPEDQRETLMTIAKELIHQFFHREIHTPLIMYAIRELES